MDIEDINIGDYIVSIEDHGELKMYKTYTVNGMHGNNVTLKEVRYIYGISSFISLSDYRRLKLNKLNK